jgi:hypothetical protein
MTSEMTGGQISAWEKADETSVAEEDQAEEAQDLVKPLKRTWSREHQRRHLALIPPPPKKWRTILETG